VNFRNFFHGVSVDLFWNNPIKTEGNIARASWECDALQGQRGICVVIIKRVYIELYSWERVGIGIWFKIVAYQ
jgi:hypothetical protein